MNVSIIVNIILCVLSFLLAAISVVTVVVTLRQNSKMIEESTRPIISLYAQSINPGTQMLYLVLKNFGNSTAYMMEFSSDFDFTNCYGFQGAPRNYIEDFGKCVVAPGQARTCYIDYNKLSNPINFSIKYRSATKIYSETFCIDLRAATELPNKKVNTAGSELSTISYCLQEMLIQNL